MMCILLLYHGTVFNFICKARSSTSSCPAEADARRALYIGRLCTFKASLLEDRSEDTCKSRKSFG